MLARAGEHGLPGESVVEEEAEVTEAIHAAAHPGRTSKAEAETEADEAAGERGNDAAKADDASGDEQGESTVAVS